MPKIVLDISLFGPCIVRSFTSGQFEITGAKHRGLFALLATAPFGRRSRAFLQDTLWGVSCYDSGRQSLRRALSDIKSMLGDRYDELIVTNNTDVTLNLELVNFISEPNDGDFLEGLVIKEKSFQSWANEFRSNPERINFAAPSEINALNRAIPSITILPLKVIVGDNDQHILGDWIAEEVCRSLSRSNLLHVISHLSSRKFALDEVNIDRIKSTLGADYCISGSLRVEGDRIIVDADFINTETSQILWTRQFIGPIKSFVHSASEGIDEIVRAVGGMLASDALRFVQDRELHEVDDHRLLIAAVNLMHKATLAEFAKSRELLHELLNRIPRSAETHAWLGKWHTLCVFNGWSSNPDRDTQTAADCTARALDLNPENSFCLTIEGFVQNHLLQEFDEADQKYQLALKSNPNQALSWLLRATMFAFKDQSAEAVKAAEKARALSPVDPFGYFYDTLSAAAYMAAQDYAKTLELIDRSLLVNDRHLSALRTRITSLHYLGREEDASNTAKLLMQKQPNFRISEYLNSHPGAESATGGRIANALKSTGLPL